MLALPCGGAYSVSGLRVSSDSMCHAWLSRGARLRHIRVARVLYYVTPRTHRFGRRSCAPGAPHRALPSAELPCGIRGSAEPDSSQHHVFRPHAGPRLQSCVCRAVALVPPRKHGFRQEERCFVRRYPTHRNAPALHQSGSSARARDAGTPRGRGSPPPPPPFAEKTDA